MGIVILLFSILLVSCALVIHSYRSRGYSATLNFFLFAFLLIFARGNYLGSYLIDINIEVKYLSICFSIGEVFFETSVLYISWLLAEKTIRSFFGIKESILSVVLISGIICGCFVYAIGAISLNAGWWQKDKNILLYVATQWVFFHIYFLSAFLLIRYSKLKKHAWKTIFFILPLIPSLASRIFGEDKVLFLIEYVVLMLLISLLFFIDFSADYAGKVKK